MALVKREKLVEFGTAFLVKKGVPEKNARAVAEMAVATEAFGITTHGVSFFPYADATIPSGLDPKAEPAVVREKGSSALIDGKGGFSQLAMRVAEELAVRKARQNGIAMVAVRNVGWLGALGTHLISIARKGFFAQLSAQTNTCKDCAPIGGIDAKFSTNPWALAFPTGGGPVIADFSTASVAMGKVNRMIRLGKKAPERIFMDKEGNLTDDPKAVKEGGSILFLGGEHFGHKGYALSLWTEALTALAGGECNNPESGTKQNFNLIVIDPDAFAGNEAYLKEMKRFVAHMKNGRLLPGHSTIRLPGERGFASMREAERGIQLEDHLAGQLNALADKHGLTHVC
jgi:LDH2 family malate/lactate/ureidoglycolate dehydrogenase